jgi:iron(III) transport system ATP-binding protein
MPVAIDVEDVTVAYDGVPVLQNVSLDVQAGELVSLLGPSGCGKTTLLRAIAGLEPIAGGSIRIGGEVASGPGVHLAPERRRIGMVFQDWALFPHLSVGANVAYGLKGHAEIDERVSGVLEMVGLAGFERRAPHTLSGGQQQRVALARALAPAPGVLLMDEPFSNLDAALRLEIRTEVHRLLEELDVTAVFVTHDQDEAFVLGSRVAVLRHGGIEQWGQPTELYQRPVNPWVANFVGEANLIRATLDGEQAHTSLGSVVVSGSTSEASGFVGLAGEGSVLMRPEDLELGLAYAVTDDGAVGDVTLVEYCGRDTMYEVVLDDGQLLRCRLPSAPRFGAGTRVTVRHGGGQCVAYPDAGGSGR